MPVVIPLNANRFAVFALKKYKSTTLMSEKTGWKLDEINFNRFLDWLGPSRELGAAKYERLRHRLIIIFSSRGCSAAEEMADETLDRVIRRADKLADTYVGDPTAYIQTVAHHLHLEYLRKKPQLQPLPDMGLPQRPIQDVLEDQSYSCLEECLDLLSPSVREFILQYYQKVKREKAEHRRRLAEGLGIQVDAMRIRAHRIRRHLQACIEKCRQNSAED
jgi:DNA-directed RNA polymerase specialized sigma24 family protein